MRAARGAVTAAVLGAGDRARAQGELEIITQRVGSDYIIYVVLAVIGLFGLFIVMMVLTTIRRNRAENSLSVDFTGLTTLKSKGLLTDEEARAVRAAMAKRLVGRQNETEKKSAAGLGAEALLYADPEVQRLEAEAERKLKGGDGSSVEEPKPVSTAPVSSVGALLDDDLPPEVAQLKEAGLLTDEDLARIRARAREKKGSGRAP